MAPSTDCAERMGERTVGKEAIVDVTAVALVTAVAVGLVRSVLIGGGIGSPAESRGGSGGCVVWSARPSLS